MSITSIATIPWPEITPLEVPVNPPPFPTDALPLWLRNFIHAQATASQVPEDLTGMLALGAVSAALQGRTTAVLNNATWNEPVTLYSAIAMPPGERKSSVFTRMTQPLADWEYETQTLEFPRVSESQQELKELERTVEKADDAVIKQVVRVKDLKRDETMAPDTIRKEEGDLDSLREEAVEARIRLEQHETLYRFRLLYNDLTPEACAQGLSQQKHEALAIMTDEGGVFEVLSGGRYSDRLNLDVFLQGHSGGRIQIDRVGRPSERVNRAMLTLGLAVQPSVLRDIGKSKQMHGRGLLARFAYSMPRTLIGRRIVDPPNVPDAINESYNSTLASIAASAYNSPEVVRVFPTEDADRRFMIYQQVLEPRLHEDYDEIDSLNMIPDWANKLAGLVGRIATIIATAREGHIPESITLEDVESAIQFGAYLESHARIAFALMGLTPNIGLEQKIIRKIRALEWPEFKTRELQHKLSAVRDYSAAEVDEVLEGLQKMGYLRKQTISQKPERHYWLVNPAVHEEES